MKTKNYRTQTEYIDAELENIALITDRGERVGLYTKFKEKLISEARQYSGHYQGVGAACYEGRTKINRLIDLV